MAKHILPKVTIHHNKFPKRVVNINESDFDSRIHVVADAPRPKNMFPKLSGSEAEIEAFLNPEEVSEEETTEGGEEKPEKGKAAK